MAARSSSRTSTSRARMAGESRDTAGDRFARTKRDDDAHQRIQDECAVSIITRSFQRALGVLEGDASAVDRDIIDTFLGALDDGTLVGILVHVPTRRANTLVSLVSKFADRALVWSR